MDVKEKIKTYWPVAVVLLVACGYVIYRLALKEWDPAEIAELGTRYLFRDPNGSEGYDGQFAYYIARNPIPNEVSSQLDVPAYRYQRILYPLLARIVAFGKSNWIPWSLILINLVSHLAASVLLCQFMTHNHFPSRYVLVYGLWAGLVVGVGTDLYEPLAYALVVAALYSRTRDKLGLGNVLLVFALLTKETAIPFWIACVVTNIFNRRPKKDVLLSLLPGVIYAVWQVWLYIQFGAFGVASGGAMATPFEWFPYGGFLKISTAGLEALGLFLLLYGPTIIWPNLWGTIVSIRSILRGDLGYPNWALLLNTLFLTFLPFSTFREPVGLVRVASGMVVAFIFFSVARDLRRPLNYAMFWMVMLLLIIR